jgi:hypothetical protein
MFQGVYLWGPLATLLCLAILFVGLIVFASSRRMRERTDRAEDVKIVSSQHYFAPSSTQGTSAVVIGTLRNDSDKSLDHIELEVQFFNPKDEMIDLISGSLYVDLTPKKELPFKISEGSNIHLPEAEYAAHKIRVMHAYESR